MSMSELRSDSEEEFEVSKNKRSSNSKDNNKLGQSPKGKSKPGKKQNKSPRKKKQPRKKKESKSKGKDDPSNREIYEYLERQNRPYNLLNIYDNLHGTIKKPALEKILEELVEDAKLVAKDFGKNRVYMLNQTMFAVDVEIIEKVGSQLTELSENCTDCQAEFKEISDKHKTIVARKTLQELRR